MTRGWRNATFNYYYDGKCFMSFLKEQSMFEGSYLIEALIDGKDPILDVKNNTEHSDNLVKCCSCLMVKFIVERHAESHPSQISTMCQVWYCEKRNAILGVISKQNRKWQIITAAARFCSYFICELLWILHCTWIVFCSNSPTSSWGHWRFPE